MEKGWPVPPFAHTWPLLPSKVSEQNALSMPALDHSPEERQASLPRVVQPEKLVHTSTPYCPSMSLIFQSLLQSQCCSRTR